MVSHKLWDFHYRPDNDLENGSTTPNKPITPDDASRQNSECFFNKDLKSALNTDNSSNETKNVQQKIKNTKPDVEGRKRENIGEQTKMIIDPHKTNTNIRYKKTKLNLAIAFGAIHP